MDIILILWEDIDIILGNFNINPFLQDLRLEGILRAFKSVTNSLTHLSGSVIDNVYMKKNLVLFFLRKLINLWI